MATLANELREEGKMELAKNMLKNDMKIKTIIELTGLDKQKIILKTPSLEENRDFYKETINKRIEIIKNVAESFREEGKTELILNMLKYGMEVEEIIEVANLDREKVNITKEVKYNIDLG